MILVISYWQLWEKNCVFGCYFEVLWVRWGVVRVEWFGVKFGRSGAIFSKDIFVFMVSKFYDFGERVFFGSGDGLKSVDFTSDLGDF